MYTHWLKKKINYDGSQLSSRWIGENFKPGGDFIVAFTGACSVKNEYMVDLEDLKAGNRIYSEVMLHFIAQHTNPNLTEAVLKQRLLICAIKEVLLTKNPDLQLTRSGDDLFEADRKLTISIATRSETNSLIHAGINISSKNTPVATRGLADYNIDPKEFAHDVLKRYKEEIDSIEKCVNKVKWVD